MLTQISSNHLPNQPRRATAAELQEDASRLPQKRPRRRTAPMSCFYPGQPPPPCWTTSPKQAWLDRLPLCGWRRRGVEWSKRGALADRHPLLGPRLRHLEKPSGQSPSPVRRSAAGVPRLRGLGTHLWKLGHWARDPWQKIVRQERDSASEQIPFVLRSWVGNAGSVSVSS